MNKKEIRQKEITEEIQLIANNLGIKQETDLDWHIMNSDSDLGHVNLYYKNLFIQHGYNAKTYSLGRIIAYRRISKREVSDYIDLICSYKSVDCKTIEAFYFLVLDLLYHNNLISCQK